MAPRTDPDPGEPTPDEPTDHELTAHIPTGHIPAEETTAGTVLEQMGGISGLIYTTIPVAVFVPVNAVAGLAIAAGAAIAAAVAILVFRLVRREPVMPAISGLLGVAICVFIAYRVGDAKGYFLFGIWMSLVYAAVLALSIVVRWPLIGVAWNAITGTGTDWRRHRPTLIAYDIVTGFWVLVFVSRYLAQSALYDDDATGWLAVARIGMGWPLTALAVLVTVVLVRRADQTRADQSRGDQTTTGNPGDGHSHGGADTLRA